MYPYIDWARMPFSSYGDFFRLRGILDDCGAVWTNAYGRSNEEADSTRKYLTDYSGKGRDIELFNFGYSRQSGFNGYVQDFRLFENPNGTEAVITEGSIAATNTLATGTWILAFYGMTKYVNKEWRVMAEIEEGASASLIFYVSADNTQTASVPFHNGLNVIPVQDYGEATSVAISLSRGKSLTLTQVPEYPGAIVGDGVDDYGQCVKGFALPDDYTMVAMREILNGGASGIINKTRATSQGAFIFEYAGTQSYSYGDNNSGLSAPKLFSYQTKASYNGTVLTPGTGTDTADDKLLIFRLRDGVSNYISAALYSFGIFNRTLTEDELRTVENCMYAEWICMTGKLEDIEYYDILDARFRSNDEAADKRNRWVGRFGKLHMTLHNYAFTGMSGWDGRNESFDEWNCRYVVAEKPYKIRIDKISDVVGVYRALKENELQISFKVRVSGVTKLMLSGEIMNLRLVSLKNTSNGIVNEYAITEDGLYSFNAWDVGEASGIGWFPYKTGVTSFVSLSSPITIDACQRRSG